MRRVVTAALLVLGCGGSPPPQIDSFTADNSHPLPGAEVHLTYLVRGASSITITPEPGQVTSSPVTVRPLEPTTYKLRAVNKGGAVSKEVIVDARNPGAAAVLEFSVVPSQGPAGTPRTLSWKITNGLRTTLAGGASGSIAIGPVGSSSDAPVQTTTYTLSATSSVGFTPAQITARAVARVVAPTAITSLTATPSAILQGDAATLRWDGTALGWAVAANAGSTNLGVAKSLVVRPSATTTYALTGTGPGGVVGPRQITVTVTPRAATALVYTPPVVSSEKLQLIAACVGAPPCTTMTLRLVTAAAVALRGVAIDLPLDSTKLSLDPLTFVSALDAGKAVLGTGPLRDTLVLGVAMKGTGTAPAADQAFAAGAELARFSVALQAAGGQGIVFDGAAAFASFIQSASGRTPGGIAVGRLEAK